MGSEEEGWGYVSVEALTAINFASFALGERYYARH